MWDDLKTHSPQTSTVQPLKFVNTQVIWSHALLGMRLPIHAGILDQSMIVKTAPESFILCKLDIISLSRWHDNKFSSDNI